MKKYRAVVEISVPDKVDFGERKFAKQLRRHMLTSLHLAPYEMATRPLEFKEFSRVVQYSPDGIRIAALRPPSSFERLVLAGLWMIVSILLPPKQRRDKNVQQWRDEVRATLDPSVVGPEPAGD